MGCFGVTRAKARAEYRFADKGREDSSPLRPVATLDATRTTCRDRLGPRPGRRAFGTHLRGYRHLRGDLLIFTDDFPQLLVGLMVPMAAAT